VLSLSKHEFRLPFDKLRVSGYVILQQLMRKRMRSPWSFMQAGTDSDRIVV